ncbi:Nucleoporin nup85, partial [Coemansia sp. RSA 1285]
RIFADGPSADDLAANPDVWPYLKKLALRGHVTTMANMLDRIAPAKSRVSASVARWAREVARIARAMPLGSDEETAGSFNARWRLWNGELQSTATAIRSLLASPSPSPSTKEEAEEAAAASADAGSGDPALESLYSIVEAMRGDAAAISAQSETWQDMMGATLLYSEPTAQADRLPTLAAEVVDEFQTHEFAILDRTLVALLRHELPEFLVYSNQIDPWLSAHISDMMEHINILGVCRRVFAVEPREHYVIELGEVYMSHEDLWRVGLEYLGMSGSSGGGCAGAGPAHLRRTRPAARGGPDPPAAGAAEVAAGAAGRGDLAYGPTIDGVLAATGVRHDRLDFLSRYRDFHACYGAGDPVAAGRILLAIITAGIAPPHAVPDLLVDAIPLLEGDALVFSADDTFELLRRAEEEKRDRAGDSSSSSSSEMSVFSVACARNLARAFVAA